MKWYATFFLFACCLSINHAFAADKGYAFKVNGVQSFLLIGGGDYLLDTGHILPGGKQIKQTVHLHPGAGRQCTKYAPREYEDMEQQDTYCTVFTRSPQELHFDLDVTSKIVDAAPDPSTFQYKGKTSSSRQIFVISVDGLSCSVRVIRSTFVDALTNRTGILGTHGDNGCRVVNR